MISRAGVRHPSVHLHNFQAVIRRHQQRRSHLSSLIASAIDVAGSYDKPAVTDSTNGNKAAAASKANKAKLVVITKAMTATMLTLASQMEKLAMVTMAMAESTAMKSMIPTLRMTVSPPLKLWDSF